MGEKHKGKKVIITADDYGMCRSVNDAICAGIENGMISTTNVMVNRDAPQDAAHLRTRYPTLTVGIHFNVTDGSPICDPAEIPTLVDADGQFYDVREFKKRMNCGLISPEELYRELCAQYEVFKGLCGRADYWNSHENAVLCPKAYQVFHKAATDNQITATRNYQRVYFDYQALGIGRKAREVVTRTVINIWFGWIVKKYFRMPCARVISFGKLPKTKGTVLIDALIASRKNFIEVVMHPATTAEDPLYGNLSEERLEEYRYLASPVVAHAYQENHIDIVGFDSLVEKT